MPGPGWLWKVNDCAPISPSAPYCLAPYLALLLDHDAGAVQGGESGCRSVGCDTICQPGLYLVQDELGDIKGFHRQPGLTG